jgi:hypothetical protein
MRLVRGSIEYIFRCLLSVAVGQVPESVWCMKGFGIQVEFYVIISCYKRFGGPGATAPRRPLIRM